MSFPRARAARIQLLVLDVDGVLTDGRLHFSAGGEDMKVFHVRDGLAMVAARKAGLLIAVISGRASPAVSRRMAELGVEDLHQGVSDKSEVLAGIRSRLGLEMADIAVMGDDLNDLPLMRDAGLALAPLDAAPEVRRSSHWISRQPGGAGAVREAIEMLLKARKAWPPGEK